MGLMGVQVVWLEQQVVLDFKSCDFPCEFNMLLSIVKRQTEGCGIMWNPFHRVHSHMHIHREGYKRRLSTTVVRCFCTLFCPKQCFVESCLIS